MSKIIKFLVSGSLSKVDEKSSPGCLWEEIHAIEHNLKFRAGLQGVYMPREILGKMEFVRKCVLFFPGEKFESFQLLLKMIPTQRFAIVAWNPSEGPSNYGVLQ